MKTKISSADLHHLLEFIKSSEVVESRVHLLSKLEDQYLSNNSDLENLADCLTTLWEDFTCLDVSQCMLNKAILHVAAKHIKSDVSNGLPPFLALSTKASIWCGKHLNMTLMSSDDSQEEEHSGIFYQLLLDFLNLSAANFSALASRPLSVEKVFTMIVEKFILEQLSLMRELISAYKRIQSCCTEILKAVGLILGAAGKLCKSYSELVNWGELDAKIKKGESKIGFPDNDKAKHVLEITRCAIEKFSEIGVLAVNDGGSLVSILNLSWKGVVSLLQLCNGTIAVKVNIPSIILTLVSLARESLKCATDAWSLSLKEPISITEARKTFVPVKFYLINAAKIASQYPSQAVVVYKDIVLCMLLISNCRVSLSSGPLTRTASQVLTELLGQTSLDLLNSLLNSTQVNNELKLEILDSLFVDEVNSTFVDEVSLTSDRTTTMDGNFSAGCEAMTCDNSYLLGRIILFLDFLKCSHLEEDVRSGLARKLGWFLDSITCETLYSSILLLEIPMLHNCRQTAELVWNPMFSYILHSLKIFMLLNAASCSWWQFESFLVENFSHPHFLCWQIVMELWCFMLSHAEADFVHDMFDKLCSVTMLVSCPDSLFLYDSPLRKMARSICMLLTSCTQSVVERVYSSIINDDGCESSLVVSLALLMEGFPLGMLSDKLKSFACEQLVAKFVAFTEIFDENTLRNSSSGVYGASVFALSAALKFLQVEVADIDTKTLKLLVSLIRNCRDSAGIKNHPVKLLGETLEIISNMKNLYESDAVEEVILELQNLFISQNTASNPRLFHCKPGLASFMASLAHMPMPEGDDGLKTTAVSELYHMLLRERHWAFVHLAITAFGYFAARTTCNELWRFVPDNAALSYDSESGNEASVERFMSELKEFLEKELALPSLNASSEQLDMLSKDALLLKEKVQNFQNQDVVICDRIEIKAENQVNKRRKLPDRICEGVELLQTGLKIIGDGLSNWEQSDSSDLQNKFQNHVSCLEDVISHLVGLAQDE